MITTADTPFVRQIRNLDGKNYKTCYFCSESCKRASYVHNFDGFAWKRKKERDATRNVTEKNRKYYEAHAEQLRERSRNFRATMTEEDMERERAYRRAYLREYRARKKEANGTDLS